MTELGGLARLLRQLSWLGALLGCFGCNAAPSGAGARPSSSAEAHSAALPSDGDLAKRPEGCKPQCRAACGGSDGCGGTCGCKEGLTCQEGVCLDSSCGPCRPNERCAAGKCECVPDCAGRACQGDGCGGDCPCPGDLVVNAHGETVSRDACKDRCQGSSFACGKLCGVDCGKCGDGQRCEAGTCQCAPKCDGTSCSDGCGGSCECASGTVCNAASQCVPPAQCKDSCASTGLKCGGVCSDTCGSCGDGQSCLDGQCREAVSCTDCGLKLRLIERQVLSKKIVRVKLAVDFEPSSEQSGPRLVDVRVASDHQVSLVQADAGPALASTGKDLFVDQTTQDSWQEKSDHSYQLLAYSVSGTARVSAGRLMTLVFDLAEAGPVKFELLRHAQTFAPLDADGVLQASNYDHSLVVSR